MNSEAPDQSSNLYTDLRATLSADMATLSFFCPDIWTVALRSDCVTVQFDLELFVYTVNYYFTARYRVTRHNY